MAIGHRMWQLLVQPKAMLTYRTLVFSYKTVKCFNMAVFSLSPKFFFSPFVCILYT